MSDLVRIELKPLGESFEVERGTPLQDCLFTYGVEFPCGGRGRCRGCRVRVIEGHLPVTAEEEKLLSPKEREEGWRLACRWKADGPLTLEVAQWETTILADSSSFEFTPGEGLGITVDLGTTTLVAQLLDLATGKVLGVRSALNAQARHGSDVMSRIAFAVAKKGESTLAHLIRTQIGSMVRKLLDAAKVDESRLRHVVIVGNTVMHHLFCGIDLEPLSHFPFEPSRDGLEIFRASELGWKIAGDPDVRFLPCLGSFVGSDILGGILATKMHETASLSMLVDLGTNGEIVVGNKDRLLCTSTAAGPAFEGARISMGMRAATGAIARVGAEGGEIRCHVLGNVDPRGICGSGLVDAVATGLELGVIQQNGRLSSKGGSWEICPPVTISQTDVREMQLAKGAIAAGIHILLEHWGAGPADVTRLYLAGAFGNYVSRASARRIGLIEFPEETVKPAGNTALLGAKIALFHLNSGHRDYGEIRKTTEHLCLASDPKFEETYVEEMLF
jgi:uncharacterized 2Fe-2S/4Fe-4S cluster protein (DUF4445 family)